MTLDGKILVVDDDKSVLLSTVSFFEDEGYDVVSAESAEDALELLADEPVAVAVVDMRLPVMDGNDFIRAAADMKPGLKFIVLTGSAQYNIPTDIQSLGVTPEHVLKKPLVEMKVLMDAVQDLSK